MSFSLLFNLWYQPPTGSDQDKQPNQHRLKDLDARVGGDDSGDGREETSSHLSDDEDETFDDERFINMRKSSS